MTNDYSGREIPLVHLNGTGKAELLEQCVTAARAICEARKALGEMSPHPRDYYPLEYQRGDAVFRKARAEHCDRLNRLQALAEEITHIWEAIDAQGNGR